MFSAGYRLLFALFCAIIVLIIAMPASARDTNGTVWRSDSNTVDNNTTIEFHLVSASGDLLRVSDVDSQGASHDFVDLSGVMVNGIIWGNNVQQLGFWIHGSYGFRRGTYDIRAEVFEFGRKKVAETGLGQISIDCWEHKGEEVRLPLVSAPADLKNVELLILHVHPIASEPCVGDNGHNNFWTQAAIDTAHGIGGGLTWLVSGEGDHTPAPPKKGGGTGTGTGKEAAVAEGVYTDVREPCNGGGYYWYVFNNSNSRVRANISIYKNNKFYRKDIFEVNAKKKASLNVCSIDNESNWMRAQVDSAKAF